MNWNVKILRNLDKHDVHPLASKTVYLTYTLSYYDILIRPVLRLRTMEYPNEDRTRCNTPGAHGDIFNHLVQKL